MGRKLRKHITIPENLYNDIEKSIIDYEFNGDFSAFVVFCINLYVKLHNSNNINKARRSNNTSSSFNQPSITNVKPSVTNTSSSVVNTSPTVKSDIPVRSNVPTNPTSGEEESPTINFIDGIMKSLN